MGISYSSRKCTMCGSTKFNYIEETKMWECAYCGNILERHEESDTLFTIKNVVRQALIDVSYQRFPEAKGDIIECEKIDARYVGTIIAKICYFMNAAFYDKVTPQEQRNMIAQLKKYCALLSQTGDAPSEEEIALYEFLDSAEAFGTLILAYDTLNSRKRIEAIYPMFKPEEIYSLTLNSNLIKYMLKHQQYEIVDKIVSNYDNIDKRSALSLLLNEYPDTEQKAINCNLIISQNILTFDERNIIESYLDNSADSVKTKFAIACEALLTAASPSVKCVMSSVITKLDSFDDVKKIFEIILSKKLNDSEVYTIIEYAFQKCPQEIILYIVNLFKDTSQFVVLNHQHFIMLLENRSVNNDYKKKITDVALNFNVTDKSKDNFVSYYLNRVADDFEKRDDFIAYLFTVVPTISTAAAESYIIYVSLDGENKPKIVERIFNLNINKSFFRDTFDKYVTNNHDSPAVSERIIEILSAQGLSLSENALAGMLISASVNDETKMNLLRRLKNSGTQYLALLDKYIMNIPPNSYSGYILQELINNTNSVSFEAVAKYLFQIRDSGDSKAVTAKNLADRCKIPFINQSFKVNHLNSVIECSSLQAYILISPDAPETTCAVLNALGAQNIKLNTDILISGTKKKFKKYLAGVRTSLSPQTERAASELRLL